MEDRRDLTGTPPPPSAATDAAPPEQPTSRRRGGGQKRKSTALNSGGGSSNSQTSSKRQAREKPPPVPFPPIHMNGPCTRARVQPNHSNSLSLAAALVKSEAEAREAAMKTEEMRGVRENWEALEAKIEAEYEAIRSREANVHVVPVHAGWFSWTKIHALEEKMLPSFFNGKIESRTPEIYMEIRNSIMKKFHFNPNVHIELKDLAELTVGESDARQEVLEFLDYWGLINYHPFPQNEPAAMIVDADADADEAGKTDSLANKLFQFESVQSWTPVIPRINTAVPTMSSGLFPESVIADELVKSEGPAVEYHCNSCSADCSRKRYHCQKQADFDLCAECFNNGKFGSNMSPSDFILMEPAEAGGGGGGSWTDQETLLLLEAIELFRDNWSEIAEHVATKTKAQCILHFVQMPIEDAFFNHDNDKNGAPKENGLPVSIGSANSAPKAGEDGDNSIKDVPEKTETQVGKTDIQASPCPMEISKPNEVHESDKTCEVREGFVLEALKEAFEAVGSLPSPGGRLSFAEAGNPVMTLAAFLVRLVEPNFATASVRSLLKSLSSNHPNEQLAARHSFRLEDPPHDKKNPTDSEGAAIETTEPEAQKDEGEHTEKQNDETPSSVVEDISLRSDENEEKKDFTSEENTGKKSASEENGEKRDSASEDKEKKNSASEDQKRVASPSIEDADKADTLKNPDKLATREETQSAPVSVLSDCQKELAPKDVEESMASPSDAEVQSNSVKESGDGAIVGETSQTKEPLKIENISNPEKKETELMVMSNSMTDKDENKGDKEVNESDSEKKEPLVTNTDVDIKKLKQAAVAALSAAAVKAKLLADQEEDQIRQLSAFLIEKQLHKLETKLAFFNDMESVVMRVKEQLDRSKQRLFHERAQIIATRFGMSSSARPNSQVLLPNKIAAAFPNSASRPFMGLSSLRPPVSRPMMTPNPASSTLVPPSAAGNSIQPNADNLSSVVTK